MPRKLIRLTPLLITENLPKVKIVLNLNRYIKILCLITQAKLCLFADITRICFAEVCPSESNPNDRNCSDSTQAKAKYVYSLHPIRLGPAISRRSVRGSGYQNFQTLPFSGFTSIPQLGESDHRLKSTGNFFLDNCG